MLDICSDIKVVALDRDPVAHQSALQMASHHPLNILPVLGKFSDLPKLLDNLGMQRGSIDGMLFDFGCSSMQMDDANRGFSISKDGPLDMRMNCSPANNEPTAAETLAHIEEEDLVKTIKVVMLFITIKIFVLLG
jgi:16S rRNA C1402 N4-methylase RsmH